MQTVKPDARVHFGQSHAPTDETLAQAILQFADAIAKGDSTRMGTMLAMESKSDLDALVGSGQWEEGTANIEAVRVVNLNDLTSGGPGGGPGGSGASTAATVQFAIQDPTGAYLLGFEAIKVSDRWAFKGIDAPSTVKGRAIEFDGAASVGGTSAPPAAAETAAGAADPAQTPAIMAHVIMEVNRRIASAAEIKVDASAVKAGLTAQGMDAAAIDGMAESGKAAIAGGASLDAPSLLMCFMVLKQVAAATGGKVTEAQVIQFISNVLKIPEKQVRDAVGVK